MNELIERVVHRLRAIRWVRLGLALGGVVTGMFLVVLTLMYVFLSVPTPDAFATAQAVRVTDVHDRTIGSISAGANRVSIPLKDVPPHVREAVIAIEDRHFYKHRGVRVTSIVRAALRNIVARGAAQGGSTITQQYVKNAFVGNDKTLLRKMKEAVLAVKLEKKKTKDQILEDYLNTIYFGRGAYGIESAARTHFGIGAKSLTVPQAALLAAIIQAPEATDPTRHPERAESRRKTVIRAMVRDGYLTEKEGARAEAQKPRVRLRRAGGTAPHFMEDVRLDLEKRFGARALYQGGVTVTTTLDMQMQEAAERAVRTLDAPRSYVPDLALVAIDPATGGIRAMVGARDFGERQLNLARSARQPGSTFKPAVLAAALRDGSRLADTFPAPGTRTFKLPGGKTWTVSNYDGKGRGTLDLIAATAHSVNTVFAALMVERTDPQTVADLATSLGIRSKLDPFYSLALGTEEVTPVDLTSMYATFAARGIYHRPFSIVRVRGRKGEMFKSKSEPARALAQATADRVSVALQAVVRGGTGRRADIGRPAAGKTGTTEGRNDTWFAGYTPDLAAAVWNGHPEGGKRLPRDAVGGKYPAQLWREFMREALKGTPARAFAVPEDQPPTDSPTPSPSPSASSSSPVPSQPPSPVPTLPTSSATPPGQTKKTSPTETASPSASSSSSPSP